jgi:hypothetical protein
VVGDQHLALTYSPDEILDAHAHSLRGRVPRGWGFAPPENFWSTAKLRIPASRGLNER